MFPPEQKIIAGVVDSRQVRLWDVDARTVQQTLPVLDGVTDVAFSSDCRLLASALCNGMIQRWNLPTGAPLATLTGPRECSAIPFELYSRLTTKCWHLHLQPGRSRPEI